MLLELLLRKFNLLLYLLLDLLLDHCGGSVYAVRIDFMSFLWLRRILENIIPQHLGCLLLQLAPGFLKVAAVFISRLVTEGRVPLLATEPPIGLGLLSFVVP